jgi:CRISPR-associated protein Cas1
MDLIINEYGTKVGVSGERIVLSLPGIKEKKEYPVRRIEKIIVSTPASITTHAVKLAIEHDVDIVFLGKYGMPVGRFFSSKPKGLAALRRGQLEAATSDKAFELSKSFIKGKCANQINYMRYLSYKYKKDLGNEILQAEAVFNTIDLIPHHPKQKDQLLGTEGYIAERYFSSVRKLFKFPGRKPQGRDKFNSALNYGYGILYNEIEKICLYVGLDPYLGLYHGERYGKPALVLDLVEEFRVPAIDSAIFPLFIENKMSKTKYFERTGRGQYQLSAEGKPVVVSAVFKMLNHTVIWQGKNYTLKAAMENQIRSLARYFLERENKYIPFDTGVMFPAHG